MTTWLTRLFKSREARLADDLAFALKQIEEIEAENVELRKHLKSAALSAVDSGSTFHRARVAQRRSEIRHNCNLLARYRSQVRELRAQGVVPAKEVA